MLRGEVVAWMSALLYPNPTSGVLNIQFLGIEGKVQLDMFTAAGSLVIAQQLAGVVNSQVVTFNV